MGHQHALSVKVKIQTIGINEVGKPFEIALLLLFVGILHRPDIEVDIFCLHMADGDRSALENEIWRTALHALGFVDRLHIVSQGGQQRLKRWSVGMFPGNARFMHTLYS